MSIVIDPFADLAVLLDRVATQSGDVPCSRSWTAPDLSSDDLSKISTFISSRGIEETVFYFIRDSQGWTCAPQSDLFATDFPRAGLLRPTSKRMQNRSFCFVFPASFEKDRILVQSLKQRGTEAFQKQRFSEAIEFYEKAVEVCRHLDQTSDEIPALIQACLSNIAICGLKLNGPSRQRLNGTVLACNEVLIRAPGEAKCHHRAGMAFETAGFYKAAHYHLTQSAKLAPSQESYAAVARVAAQVAASASATPN